jgi:tetratricopeptide (TPR) repeat protein
VISEDKPPTLMTTPADPPFKASLTFQIKAKLNNTGTLEGKIERTIQGDDNEVLLRSAFRRVPLPQWKNLVQQISYASGFAGDVSEVTAGSPEKTDEPFHFAYGYTRKDFPNWSERQINSPLPRITLPQYETKPSHPVWLGAPAEAHLESQVEIPKGYTPKLPKSVHIKRDFADFDSVYVIKEGVLTTDRHLVTKLREVPVSSYEDYDKFCKAVEDDYNSSASLSSTNSSATSSPDSYQNEIWALPYSDNQDAAKAYDDAREEYKKNDPLTEIASLKRAVGIDPKFTRAWLWLGEIYKSRRQHDLALQAYRKALEIDSTQPVSYKALASTLIGMRKYDDALSVLQDLVKVAPDDVDGPTGLGGVLFALKRYSEAASALEAAVKLSPQRVGLQVQLGSAYLRIGEDDKALTAYQKALELDAQPLMFNHIAYELGDANKKLPLALEYAQNAVREEEEVSQKVKLSELQIEQLGHTARLGAFWDTLGWVLFRTGDLGEAEKYLNAAWILSQGSVVGDHLGQVYQKQQKKELAVHMYQLALAASRDPDQMKETQARLQHLGDTRQTLRIVAAGGGELSNMRTTKLVRIVPSSTAEFFILFGPGAKVEDTKFISGSESLKSAGKVLSSTRFNLLFPDEGPTRLLRRGVLDCNQYSGCSIVLINPNDVHSVN